jgi:hypothetical protein
MVHHPCLAHHHDCSKTQVAEPVAEDTTVVSCVRLIMPDLFQHARALSTAPRSSLPDLITLFGTFLI